MKKLIVIFIAIVLIVTVNSCKGKEEHEFNVATWREVGVATVADTANPGDSVRTREVVKFIEKTSVIAGPMIIGEDTIVIFAYKDGSVGWRKVEKAE